MLRNMKPCLCVAEPVGPVWDAALLSRKIVRLNSVGRSQGQSAQSHVTLLADVFANIGGRGRKGRDEGLASLSCVTIYNNEESLRPGPAGFVASTSVHPTGKGTAVGGCDPVMFRDG